MAQKRGRKTSGDAEAEKRGKEKAGRPPAPEHLDEAQAREWNEIVASQDPGHFTRSQWPMLASYCIHACNIPTITTMIADAPQKITEGKMSVMDYNRLLGMLNRETKTLASFGVRLGIARTSMAGRHNHDPDNLDRRNGAAGVPWATPPT